MSDVPNLYRGVVRPFAPRPQSPSLWEHVLFIGRNPDNKYFSRIVIRLKPATIQYPNPALFLQLGTGAGSALVRISVQELDEIRDAVIRWAEECKPLMEKAEAEAKLLEDQRRKFDEARAVIRMAQEMQQNGPEDDFVNGDDGGFEPPTSHDTDVPRQTPSRRKRVG